MSNTTPLSQRDLQHVWHPCTQMKDHEQVPLLEIKSALGCYLTLSDGRRILDGISSWWCKNLGHANPRLKHALQRQLDQFEHVILAGTTNDIIVRLSECLASLMPSLNKVFFASDGSSAVEIALKMSLHSRLIEGESKRTRFLALSNGYHGETIGAMSVSDLGMYKRPYETLLFQTRFIDRIPYVSGKDDPLWHDCQEHWDNIEKQLIQEAEYLTAIIVEPIVQGAGGMKIYSADFLKRLSQWARAHNVHLIADEIMTGIGRTGKMLACEHAGIVPDFLCLSKGLTAGFLPMSTVLTTQNIYDYFYDDYKSGHSFLHSHTFSGNPLAAAVAYETLQIMQMESIPDQAAILGKNMLTHFNALADELGILENVRGIGGIVAAELPLQSQRPRLSLDIATAAAKNGVLLRPIGNTLYWMPPLIAKESELVLLRDVTRFVLRDLFLK